MENRVYFSFQIPLIILLPNNFSFRMLKSSLFFCIIPLLNMINKQHLGYELKDSNKIILLFYMDDIKTFIDNEEQMA